MELTRRFVPIKSFKVDPYHGFVFWIEEEDSSTLIQLEEQCSDQDVFIVELLRRNKLGDFAIRFEEFKLQVADLAENSLLEIDIQTRRSKSLQRVTPRQALLDAVMGKFVDFFIFFQEGSL